MLYHRNPVVGMSITPYQHAQYKWKYVSTERENVEPKMLKERFDHFARADSAAAGLPISLVAPNGLLDEQLAMATLRSTAASEPVAGSKDPSSPCTLAIVTQVRRHAFTTHRGKLYSLELQMTCQPQMCTVGDRFPGQRVLQVKTSSKTASAVYELLCCLLTKHPPYMIFVLFSPYF